MSDVHQNLHTSLKHVLFAQVNVLITDGYRRKLRREGRNLNAVRGLLELFVAAMFAVNTKGLGIVTLTSFFCAYFLRRLHEHQEDCYLVRTSKRSVWPCADRVSVLLFVYEIPRDKDHKTFWQCEFAVHLSIIFAPMGKVCCCRLVVEQM